jgi:integrase
MTTRSSNVPAVIRRPAGLPVAAAEIAERAAGYAAQAQSENTRMAYASDWAVFQAWCETQGAIALPADSTVVLAFLVDTAGHVKVSTQRRRLSAIKEMQRQAGYHLDTTSALFRDTWKGIRRAHGQPPVKKSALLTPLLRRALATLPDNLTGIRDRALLLIGFAGALRRTELAAVEVTARPGADRIEEMGEGLVVHLASSKGDQEGAGQAVGIPFGLHPETCPVRALRAWLQAGQITEGRIFRQINRHGHVGAEALCDHSVAFIIKRAIVAGELGNGASEEEALVTARRFAGHSLRSGLATSAAANDTPGHLIQRQLRHKKFDTTVGYIQDAELLKKNAAAMVGL